MENRCCLLIDNKEKQSTIPVVVNRKTESEGKRAQHVEYYSEMALVSNKGRLFYFSKLLFFKGPSLQTCK